MNMDIVKSVIEQAMIDLHGVVEPDNDFYRELILPISMYLVISKAKDLRDNIKNYIVFPHKNDPLYNIALEYSVVLFNEEEFTNNRKSTNEYVFNSRRAERYMEMSENICILRNMGETIDEVGEKTYKYKRYTIASTHWGTHADAVIDFISFRNMNKMCYDIITPYKSGEYRMLNIDCGLPKALYYLSQNPSSKFEFNRTKECVIFLNDFIEKYKHDYADGSIKLEDIIDYYKNDKFREIGPIIMRIMREIYKDNQENIEL